MSSLYPQNLNFSPARNFPSPRLRANTDIQSHYLTELLAERQKLAPFMQVIPICSRLLDQEILRISGRISSHGFNEYDRLQRASPGPVAALDIMPDISGKAVGGWSGSCWSSMQHERLSGPQSMSVDWKPPGSPSSFVVKRVLRLDIPVDRYPNFNFVGRLLGPRGNSLKRVEVSTGCRVFIRGKGSIKDADKEESLRGKPGYEHLNEALHILVEADVVDGHAGMVDTRLKEAKEIIEDLLKPVDESQDMYKRQQLRELAMLNNIREDSPQPGCIVSPFSSGLKRPKTSW